MKESCSTCKLERACEYPYKPTECFEHRKFKLNPSAKPCTACNPIDMIARLTCVECKGSGILVEKKE